MAHRYVNCLLTIVHLQVLQQYLYWFFSQCWRFIESKHQKLFRYWHPDPPRAECKSYFQPQSFNLSLDGGLLPSNTLQNQRVDANEEWSSTFWWPGKLGSGLQRTSCQIQIENTSCLKRGTWGGFWWKPRICCSRHWCPLHLCQDPIKVSAKWAILPCAKPEIPISTFPFQQQVHFEWSQWPACSYWDCPRTNAAPAAPRWVGKAFHLEMWNKESRKVLSWSWFTNLGNKFYCVGTCHDGLYTLSHTCCNLRISSPWHQSP